MRKMSTIDQIAAIFAISPSFLFIPLFLCIFFLQKKKKRKGKEENKNHIRETNVTGTHRLRKNKDDFTV